jgi:long-chain acyl-CoA synthetase
VIQPNAELSKDLNLDSLSRVELLSAIEDRYQIDLDEGLLTDSTTVGDLEQIVRGENGLTNNRKRFSYPLWPLRFPVSWIRIVFYYLMTFPITLILCRVDRRGLENLDQLKGPVVFASNHVTYVDPGLIMSALPGRFLRRLAIAMDGERLMGYRHPPPGTPVLLKIRQFLQYWLVVALFNTFPLPRRSAFRQSFSFAGEAMDRGYNILIFPEGELTKDGHLQNFRSGVGILADGLEADIVPISIEGLYELRARGQRLHAPPGSVRIVFGSPIRFDRSASPKEITEILEQSVAALSVEH